MKAALPGWEKHTKNYAAALRGVGIEPVLTLDPAEALRLDGLVLPGGGDVDPCLYGAENRGSDHIERALDEAQLAAARAFLRAGKPVLGICKGMQVINIALGGGIIQHLATADLHRGEGDLVHSCLSFEGTVLRRLYGRRFPVNSLHHQAVGRLGEGLRVTAVSPDGVPEALEHETLPVLAVQWHPERMCFGKARPDTVDGAALFRRFRELLEKYTG